MKIEDCLLTGSERVTLWEKYKSEHPNPELAEASDFAYVNKLLEAQLAKVLLFRKEGVEGRKE